MHLHVTSPFISLTSLQTLAVLKTADEAEICSRLENNGRSPDPPNEGAQRSGWGSDANDSVTRFCSLPIPAARTMLRRGKAPA